MHHTNMGGFPMFLSLVLLFFFSQSLTFAEDAVADRSQLQTYIVHVRDPVTNTNDFVKHPESMEPLYYTLLATAGIANPVPGTSLPRIVHSYSHAMTGFAARLTETELGAISNMDWFLSAYPDRVYQLQTTHTPQFLGLPGPTGLWNRTNYGEGVIVCVLDSGVTPNHPSFAGDGMPPPPPRWKGKCEPPVVCNNKLIGAQSFIPGDPSPTDENGHGTHTASTAAGAFVENASVFGFAEGSAVGMAPRAHLATYKVCSKMGCNTSTMAAGFGAAIRDGCDVISFSIGSPEPEPIYESVLSTGGYRAINSGVFVSVSAGNRGPDPNTISNEVPWVLTVAASTMDRKIAATVKLGNGEEFEGESLYQPIEFGTKMWPLVYAGNGANPDSKFCRKGTLDALDVKDKIVLCERTGISKGNNVKSAGGAGVITMNEEPDGSTTWAEAHVLPASHVGFSDGDKIKAYINSTANPIATIIFKGTVIGSPRAPVVASFSSRGPSRESPGILKPDITGPGVSILAAWIQPPGETLNGPVFHLDSGTSMSCPHLSGVAALLKAAHPDWSPAAIKSAIMTTAYVTDNTGGPILDEKLHPADVFAIGAGHVDVSRAHDPGLVYDTDPHHYDNYLCAMGYTSNQIHAIIERTVDCSKRNVTEQELNYPSIAVTLGALGTSVTVKRKVTNVGEARSRYRAEIDAPAGVSVIIQPEIMKLKKLKQRKTFNVTFTRTGGSPSYVQGQLKWVSDRHVVRSPISVKLT